jgi:hypothetical protein
MIGLSEMSFMVFQTSVPMAVELRVFAGFYLGTLHIHTFSRSVKT